LTKSRARQAPQLSLDDDSTESDDDSYHTKPRSSFYSLSESESHHNEYSANEAGNSDNETRNDDNGDGEDGENSKYETNNIKELSLVVYS
jgi:hypothetical protein